MAYKTNVTYHSNKTCQICGQAYCKAGAGVHCRKARGWICMEHCAECRHNSNWQCRYRPENDTERKIEEFYMKNGMKKPSTATTIDGNEEIQ